jgi:hypothetical protein
MKRPEHALPHDDGDRFWHRWRCAECREADRMDREIRRRLQPLLNLPPPPGLEAKILAGLGLPPEPEPEAAPRPHVVQRCLAALAQVPGARPERRLLLAATLAAAIALFHLFPQKSSANTLERVLAAMARVRTAHCSGMFDSHEGPPPDAGSAAPEQMPVEWWYQAPGRFRREMGPEVPTWGFPPGTLIINGDQSLFFSPRDPGPPLVPRPRKMRDLSPVDFFTPEGLLQRAAGKKHARIHEELSPTPGRPFRRITVEYDQPGERVPLRFHWTLTVDPATDRIVHVDWQLEARVLWRWQTGASATLDRFEYNIPLPDDLFRFDTVARPLRSVGP